jgi:hypothetical protein
MAARRSFFPVDYDGTTFCSMRAERAMSWHRFDERHFVVACLICGAIRGRCGIEEIYRRAMCLL